MPQTKLGASAYVMHRIFSNTCVVSCCSGIIMYAMVLGRLPFCTPFKDEYHRQRMLQQIHKGLSATHDREMQPLSAGNNA